MPESVIDYVGSCASVAHRVFSMVTPGIDSHAPARTLPRADDHDARKTSGTSRIFFMRTHRSSSPAGVSPERSFGLPTLIVGMSSPSQTPEQPGSRDFVKHSSLYQEFLAEREEILRHKWLESERLGYDIGFERALLDWIRKHREGWRAARRAQTAQAQPSSPGATTSLPQGSITRSSTGSTFPR